MYDVDLLILGPLILTMDKDERLIEDGAVAIREGEIVAVGKRAEFENQTADETIIEVLRGAGLTIDTSCEDGYCATCMTRYLEGEPEHRDAVLDDEDRAEFVLICCARSRTPVLVLDL